MRNASAIALLAALACIPVSEAYGQSANASDRGQEMGQGTPGGSNPNAGPGNNSGNGNTSPGSQGAAASGNSNAGPGNNSGSAGDRSAGAGTASESGSGSSAGPEGGHNCGGRGHIDNDAPGHQHDDCHADATVTGAIARSGAAIQGGTAAQARTNGAAAAPNAAGAIARTGAAVQGGAAMQPGLNRAAAGNAAGGGGAAATADCSTFNESLVPIFGMLTRDEAERVAIADTAALVPVACAAATSDADAQRAVSENPGIVNALRAQGYSLSQVITVQASDSVPTIYVEAASD